MVKSLISHTVSIIDSDEKDESLLVGSSQKSILHARPIKTNEIEVASRVRKSARV